VLVLGLVSVQQYLFQAKLACNSGLLAPVGATLLRTATLALVSGNFRIKKVRGHCQAKNKVGGPT